MTTLSVEVQDEMLDIIETHAYEEVYNRCNSTIILDKHRGITI